MAKKKPTGIIGNVIPGVLQQRQKELKDKDEPIKDPSKYISPHELKTIRDTLIQSYAELVIRGMMDKDARHQLERVIAKEYNPQTQGNKDLIVYIARETVGTGVIEDIMENDSSVTDIGFNGSHLIIESSDSKVVYGDDAGVDNNYIVRLINKFAHANGRDFTEKNPIFDGSFENIRINAMFDSNTTDGVTMALRVVRPMLALTEETFTYFAPMYMYDLMRSFVLSKGNFVIAGETGTGKTELLKLLASFIPFEQRIVLIEDVAETFLKTMFPDKDVFSWLTSPTVSITHLVKAALRNNPRWILVSETRGMEAYEMIQSVLSGHSILTTVHAVNARAIPKRMINMAKMGYEFSEEGLESDIRRYFDFGIHIIRVEYKEKTLRYLNELVYYDNEGDHTIFKQDFINGRFICQTSELPDAWKRRLAREGHNMDAYREYRAHERFAKVVRVDDEDSNGYRLDLTMQEGNEVGIDDLYKYINNEDIIAIEGDKARLLREQKERERENLRSVQLGEEVEQSLFKDEIGPDGYEYKDTEAQSAARKRLAEIQAERTGERSRIKTEPDLTLPNEDVSDEVVEEREDSAIEKKVQSEAEAILARYRARQRQQKKQPVSSD